MPKKDKEGKESRRESTRRASKKEKHSDHGDSEHHSEKRHHKHHHHHHHQEEVPETPPPPEEIELLSPKQNGSTAVEQQGNKASIKGMWKKAFKSLKSKDKEKDEKHEKPEKTEKSRLQRGASFLGFGGGSRESGKSHSSEYDSHQNQDPPSSPEVVQGTDSPQKESRFRRYSRQSSLKRVLKRKDSKEASSDGEPSVEGATGGGGQEQAGSYDPVFATLRNAMSMRKPSERSLSGSEIDSLPTMLDTMPEDYEEYGQDPYYQGYSRYEDM